MPRIRKLILLLVLGVGAGGVVCELSPNFNGLNSTALAAVKKKKKSAKKLKKKKKKKKLGKKLSGKKLKKKSRKKKKMLSKKATAKKFKKKKKSAKKNKTKKKKIVFEPKAKKSQAKSKSKAMAAKSIKNKTMIAEPPKPQSDGGWLWIMGLLSLIVGVGGYTAFRAYRSAHPDIDSDQIKNADPTALRMQEKGPPLSFVRSMKKLLGKEYDNPHPAFGAEPLPPHLVEASQVPEGVQFGTSAGTKPEKRSGTMSGTNPGTQLLDVAPVSGPPQDLYVDERTSLELDAIIDSKQNKMKF